MSKNKADLVAKARIEWIQEVKKIMAIYLKDVKYYPFLFKKSKLMSKKSSEYQEILNEVNELAVRISENKNLLLLHLSRSDDNKQLNDCIADCSKWISNMRIRWSIQSSGNTKVFKFEYDNTPPNNLLLVSRDYFKREWNKAKKGK